MTRWSALLLLLALPRVVDAHGALRAAVPRSGARLAAVPREIRLTFTEPVELALARLTLAAADGRPVPLSPLRAGDTRAVVVADVTDAAALVPGVYAVGWQIVGRDGHPVRGGYRFTILPGAVAAAAPLPPDPPARDTAPDTAPDSAHASHAAARADSIATPRPDGAFGVASPLYVGVRWLGLVALVALVGAAAFPLCILPAARHRTLDAAVAADAARRARIVGVVAAASLVVASLLRLAAQSIAVHGVASALDPASLGALVANGPWGLGWTLQIGAALVALLALASARARPARALLPVALAALAAAGGAALSGHAAAVEERAALALAADALHVLAAGGWLGTLLLLAGAGLPAAWRAPSGERVAATAALVGAFSPWALGCAAVAAVTGATSAWIHLGAPAALLATPYGRTLLVKLACLAPVALAGAYNWRRVRPALAAGADARAALSRSMAAELVAALAVLAVTAVLVATAP